MKQTTKQYTSQMFNLAPQAGTKAILTLFYQESYKLMAQKLMEIQFL